MPRKYNVDEMIEKMLEHADRYPELKLYADGLRYYADLEDSSAKESKPSLTKEKVNPKIESAPINPPNEGGLLATLGV